MIKFFRHIRQNQIMSNNTGKYFKYAIGEIILVVIGILIALQINNWNENRKKEVLKKSYIVNLINDLKKDTIQLNERLIRNRNTLKGLDSISNLFEATNSIDSLYNHLINNPLTLGVRVTNTYNVNTFKILISSGNIDLFSNAITDKIMELNRLQMAEIKVSEGNSQSFLTSLGQFRNEFLYVRGLDNQELIKSITSNYDAKKYISLNYNLIVILKHTIFRYIQLTTKVKLQTEVLLSELLSSENL